MHSVVDLVEQVKASLPYLSSSYVAKSMVSTSLLYCSQVILLVSQKTPIMAYYSKITHE
jgi:hypothetical protein